MATQKRARKGADGGRRKPPRRTAARPRPKVRAGRKTKRAQAPPVVTVGDAVLLRSGEPNRIGRYDARLAGVGEATEGLVYSIREIATGKLVGKTKGELEGYVLEVLHQRTFRPQFSSNQNTGGRRGPSDAASNPALVRLRAMLRELAHGNRFVSQASGALSAEAFGPLLDGWRVVKVRAQMVELQP